MFIHSMRRVKQPSEEERRLDCCLSWEITSSGRGVFYPSKQMPVPDTDVLSSCCLNELHSSCWHRCDRRKKLEENSGRTLKSPWVKAFCRLRREQRWSYRVNYIGVEIHWINWVWMNKERVSCEKEWEDVKKWSSCWRKQKSITNIC